MVAVSLMTFVPGAVVLSAVSRTVRVAVALGARVGTVHSGGAHVPVLGVTDAVTPAGSVRSSLTTTFVAVLTPLLVRVTTYCRLPGPEPATTGSMDSVFDKARSSAGARAIVTALHCWGVVSVPKRPVPVAP